MNYLSLILFVIVPLLSFSQNQGRVYGVVKDANTQEQLIGAKVYLLGIDSIVAQTDLDGNFQMQVPVGRYTLKANYFGYKDFVQFNVNVVSGNAQMIEVNLEVTSEDLDEVVVSMAKTARATDMVTPLATQKLTADEIKVNPGGNYDVSKVLQILPGVAGGTTPNRNDIIVRGGGPSENVYYLDGIEIPVLNHFQTQGASGGATGLLNVSFISDVQLTSSAFDSRYDNALASTIVIKQRNGNPDKFGGNFRLSGSEVAAMIEGPMGKKTTYMASARRSYLAFLFNLLDLPIRPDYWDFQYKIDHKIDNKTELNFIGLGAIDKFRLTSTKETSPENEYILRSNPLLNQWNYTVGGSLKRLYKDGFFTVALSRNMFYNGATRYGDNSTKEGPKLFESGSHETENKLRVDFNHFKKGWKISYGASGQYVKYDASIFNTVQAEAKDSLGNTIPAISFSTATAIDFFKMGAYGHVSKYLFKESLLISAGLRTDMNTFTTTGLNPLKTLSPRFSMSYAFNQKWNISGSVGSYYKMAPYTALGYRDISNDLKNKDLDYIQSIHYTIGTQFLPRNDFRVTFEAFYKDYRDYPVSAVTGISMANIGSDYNAIGNEVYQSIGKGRVYGVEAYVQQKLVKNLFYVVSATLYKSEFTGMDGLFRSSSWDYGYVISTTLGYKFKKGWEIGAKYRIAGGQPYTPFDLALSQAYYMTTGSGVLDYDKLNSERLPFFHQLDLRIDKKFNFKKTSLGLYLDFQNVFLYKTPYAPRFTFQRNEDNSGFATTDGNPIATDGSNAIPYIINQRAATIVPSLGIVFEF